MAMYVALRLGIALVRVVPYAWLHALAGLLGELRFHLATGRRATVLTNLRQVVGPAASEARLMAMARQVFRHAARNYLDALTVATQSLEQINARIEVQGIDALFAALEEGHGAILVAPHMGNMDVLVQYLALRKVPITVPVEHMKPERLYRFLHKLRTRFGVRLLPLDKNLTGELLACLRRNEVVGLVCDRVLGETGVHVPFFGRPALLPPGPGLLALRSGAPLLGAHAERLPGGRTRGHLLPAVHARKGGGLRLAQAAAMGQVAALLEEQIRDHPEQWTVFVPIWGAEAAGQ